MRILELLAFEPQSVPQLAAALGAQPRTVRRVVHQLVEQEYVELRDEQRRIFGPTMRLVAMAAQAVENSDLARVARPYALLLQASTHADVHVMVPSYGQVVCLVHVAGEGPASATPHIRELVPAHATAGGKALLAHREPWCRSLLTQPLASYTASTVTDPHVLRAELDEIKVRGHADDIGEYQPDVQATAVVVAIAGYAAAALSVSGRKLALDQMRPHLRRSADDLAHDLAVRKR